MCGRECAVTLRAGSTSQATPWEEAGLGEILTLLYVSLLLFFRGLLFVNVGGLGVVMLSLLDLRVLPLFKRVDCQSGSVRGCDPCVCGGLGESKLRSCKRLLPFWFALICSNSVHIYIYMYY